LLVGQALRELGFAKPCEAVVVALELSFALGLELSSQPLAAVEADLDVEGKPGLDAGVDPSELGMKAVLVEMEALARPQFQPAQARVLGEVVLEAAAGFDDGEHADQPCVDRMLLEELPSEGLFIPRARLQMPDRPIVLAGLCQRSVLELLAGGPNEAQRSLLVDPKQGNSLLLPQVEAAFERRRLGGGNLPRTSPLPLPLAVGIERRSEERTPSAYLITTYFRAHPS
jgi:hypothetical protein